MIVKCDQIDIHNDSLFTLHLRVGQQPRLCKELPGGLSEDSQLCHHPCRVTCWKPCFNCFKSAAFRIETHDGDEAAFFAAEKPNSLDQALH